MTSAEVSFGTIAVVVTAGLTGVYLPWPLETFVVSVVVAVGDIGDVEFG